MTLNYEITDPESGEVVKHEKPVSAIPRYHLERIKNMAFCFDRGVVDHLLRVAHDECDLLRSTGDPDAAILVIVRRDIKANEAKNIQEVKRRIAELFSEDAVGVQSGDDEARATIKGFKKGTGKWIIAKEMISEGTNIPRVRVVLILRDVGNRTFFEQLIHRATRNDADDRLQDAIIVQVLLPNLHNWCCDLERQALIAIEKRKEQKGGEGGRNPDPLLIEGLFAEAEEETVIIEGEDFSDVDPLGRKLQAMLGEKTRSTRWQIDLHLRGLQQLGINLSVTATERGAFSIDEQVAKFLEMGKKDIQRAGMNLGAGEDTFKQVYTEAKPSAGIKCKIGDLIREHPNPLEAAKKFAEAAHRAYQRSRKIPPNQPDASQGRLDL